MLILVLDFAKIIAMGFKNGQIDGFCSKFFAKPIGENCNRLAFEIFEKIPQNFLVFLAMPACKPPGDNNISLSLSLGSIEAVPHDLSLHLSEGVATNFPTAIELYLERHLMEEGISLFGRRYNFFRHFRTIFKGGL